MANLKSTNYVKNSYISTRSKTRSGVGQASNKGYLGMIVDKEGHLLEASVANMAVILPDKVFLLPPFDKTLQGTTSMKCLEYI